MSPSPRCACSPQSCPFPRQGEHPAIPCPSCELPKPAVRLERRNDEAPDNLATSANPSGLSMHRFGELCSPPSAARTVKSRPELPAGPSADDRVRLYLLLCPLQPSALTGPSLQHPLTQKPPCIVWIRCSYSLTFSVAACSWDVAISSFFLSLASASSFADSSTARDLALDASALRPAMCCSTAVRLAFSEQSCCRSSADVPSASASRASSTPICSLS
mmetsp:Transcript_3760/g.8961  ORF Transcript_3760/g.8961 Transcript_3760/m.8961 type:complete len:218 (+) Transcript_3760:763-1416(+)